MAWIQAPNTLLQARHALSATYASILLLYDGYVQNALPAVHASFNPGPHGHVADHGAQDGRSEDRRGAHQQGVAMRGVGGWC